MDYQHAAATAGVAAPLSAQQRPSRAPRVRRRTGLTYETRLRLYEQSKREWFWRNPGASADEREHYCQMLAKELRV